MSTCQTEFTLVILNQCTSDSFKDFCSKAYAIIAQPLNEQMVCNVCKILSKIDALLIVRELVCCMRTVIEGTHRTAVVICEQSNTSHDTTIIIIIIGRTD